MAVRSIASLSLSFGLVAIPVKLYSAAEASAAIRFKLMAAGERPLRQQYVADEVAEEEAASPVGVAPTPEPGPQGRREVRSVAERVLDFPTGRRAPAAPMPEVVSAPPVVERSDMVKGYEFEKGQFVLFTADELKALEEGSRQTIDIVAFIPEHSVDPIYYDKPYFLAPDKRGARPYSLLLRAMRESGRCALAKWAWRSKEHVVEIRPTEGGMVLQQLLYADEVRSIADLDIDLVEVGEGELKLARQLIGQIAADVYDPTQFVDEEKQRILQAVEKKIAGKQIVAPRHHETAAPSNVLDLMEALRASLAPASKAAPPAKRAGANVLPIGERKPVRRASKAEDATRPAGRRTKR
jgi:DNA end-binding protein Ku